MWEFFIKNDKFAYLFLIALIGVGSYSLISIPKESAPEVIIPVGVVSTVFPGAPAADVETLITNELERGLTSLENVSEITSTSREGVSSIVVEFEASANLEESIQSLKDEVDAIKQDLPDDASDPFVSEVNFVDQPILTVALAADLSDITFAAIGNDVEREIEQVSGVSRVQLQGVRDREVTILVDQTALAQYDLSLGEITSALRNANLTFPIGQIINDGIAYNVAFEGDIPNASELPNIAVATRNGQPVYVRDVAIVEDGLAPASSLSRLSVDGKPSQNSITFDVYKQSGGDITQITAAVNERVQELTAEGEILAGIEVSTVLDSGEQILSDLIQLSTSGLQTVILVVLLLIVAIGWREGLLAGLAIPLSFLFGFIGLFYSGNTINFLSLFALILGIGILVDSAIVMVEGINRKMKDDPTIDKRTAALETINEFWAPLTAGTLTTVGMFTGLFIVSGVTGQFIASIPFTLIFLLLASLFVSLAIIPLLATSFLKRRSASRMEQVQVAKAAELESWYKAKIQPILESEEKQFRFLAAIFAGLVFSLTLTFNMIAGLIAAPIVYVVLLKTFRWQKKYNWRNWVRTLVWLPLLGLILFGSVTVSNFIFPAISPVSVTFFEQSDVDFIIIEIENPEGTIKETTDIATRRVEELLYNEDYIESFTVTVGSGSQFGGGGSGEKFANIFVSLSDDREMNSTEIVDDLRLKAAPLRDIKVTINQPSDGPPTGAAIIVKFLGDDLGEITRLANSAAQVFRGIDGTVNVETSTNSNSTEFVLELDRARTASLGLSPFQVSQIARTAVFGSEATTLTTLTEDIKVVVKLNVANAEDINANNANNISIDALEQIQLQTQSGTVPLSSLVTVSLRESSSVIRHEDGRRVVSVTADVTGDGNAREIQAAALEQIDSELDIPASVELSTGGGETEESNRSFIELFLALIVGVVLMLGVLTLQFNSYLHTRYVLSILPYSLIGIFAGLAITQNPLSFPSIMGFIALSGIVVNNSILLIDMMNQLRKADPTRNITEVVLDAAGNRLRPILLTTMTTVIGMVPLTYAGDLWAPLAYAVMFGLVFSVVITLVLIPILYNRNPGTVER
ncbi:MAG: multidrug efflux pump subunit AcrB [Candidatus Paceibacteria bacterium]|jgi:multidrug efflux pump subunit AcrB